MSKRIKYTDEPMEAKVIPDFLPPPGKLRRSKNAPRLDYQSGRDALRMRFTSRPVKRRVKAPGVVLEYDAAGELVAIVFDHASKRFAESEQPVRGRRASGPKSLRKTG
jgi:hypothetical protein